ncbi:hypothetical protein QJS04_geneDACA005122 [Acorus gramineus]|uniref:Netrin receptor DCC n=1 Tax=Acorus gramineus TaxID=55184 RepID=A0AAV9AW01_ACOGR|nr:hypothetical protein QJS04_geneDACA005122 [Acorus gramineus]
MPPFTAAAFDRMLEPTSSRDPLPRPPVAPSAALAKTAKRNIHRPSLYTTPQATPVPDSPSSYPPSPYIVNHKRRGPRILKSFSEGDVSADSRPSIDGSLHESGGSQPSLDEACVDQPVHDGRLKNGGLGGPSEAEANGRLKELEQIDGSIEAIDAISPVVIPSDYDGFYDPQDSMSVVSFTETEDNIGPEHSVKPSTPAGEFFDAFEELSSEGASQSLQHDFEADLREMRLNLLMEIERRKQAEEATESMQNQWQKLRHQLSLVGLTLPALSTISEEVGQLETDIAEELCQQVVVARAVANSIGRGSSRAEVEMERESQIEAKNFEISRLCDRLQYYELVNQEMSQRNQAAVEMARKRRHTRKRRQKWIWGSIGVATVLSIGVLTWPYLPTKTSDSGSCEADNAVVDAEHE